MIRINDIQEAMRHLVGWEQSFNPAEYIADDLTQTESGLYYQQAHPLITLENVRAIMPEGMEEAYPQWVKDTDYKKGDKVRNGGQVWEAKQNIDDSQTAPTDGEDWAQYNVLNDYLTRLVDRNIAKTVQTFLQTKSLMKESRSLMERRSLFDGAGRMDNTIQNGQRLVGMEIVPAYSAGVTIHLERIALQMTGATGHVTLYIFHSSQRDPFKVIDFEVKKGNGSMEWQDLTDCYLPYMGDTGAWYVVYNQADLPEGMEAVNATKDWSREPCGTCNRGSLEAWRELTKYMMVSPFKVPSLLTFKDYPELWDIEQNTYTNTHNYGINMMLSVACDLTEFIIRQRNIFATVLQRQMAVDILRTLALNPEVRVNRRQSNASQFDLLYEVDGNPQGRATGMGKELADAYQALDFDTRGIDRICLACRPVGVRYTHV
jgi:hypothetical protein